ncbi:MAG: hypothetical protein AB1779_07070 [Candidatus Thermoplasmatota archaeon]
MCCGYEGVIRNREQKGETIILKVIVDDLQIGDTAPRDGKANILRNEFCKIGETISPQLSIHTTFDSLKKSEKNEKSIKLIDNIEYNINGEILAGIFNMGMYLIIDCGILLRVSIKDPREYEIIKSGNGWERFAPVKKDVMKRFTFRKHDFINFNGNIQAMWCDTWQGIVRTNSCCKIIDRVDKNNEGLLLTVECSFPEKPLIEIDELETRGGTPKIWGDSTEFSIEF